MKNSNKDNYDLTASSPNNDSGFDLFETNNKFYFHFNDKNGDCLLFSQPYESRKSAKNGMSSVEKNIRKKGRIIFHHDEESHHFTIKAGNNQEIARSRNFETMEAMDEGLGFIHEYHETAYDSILESFKVVDEVAVLKAKKESLSNQLVEKETIERELRDKLWELETTVAETSTSLNKSLKMAENWESEKAVLEEKLVLLTKKLSDVGSSQSSTEPIAETDLTFQKTAFGFTLKFYNVDKAKDLKIAIKPTFSREQRVIEGFDKEKLFDYMLSKLPRTVLSEQQLKIKELESILSETKETTARGVIKHKAVPEVTISNTDKAIQEKPSISQSASNETNPIKETQEEISKIPLAAEENSIKEHPKKVKNIYQMKALVERIKNDASDLPIPVNLESIPPIIEENPDFETVSEEELGLIQSFFGNLPNSDIRTLKKEEEIVNKTTALSLEEEKSTVAHFFPIQKKTAPSDSPSIEEIQEVLDTTIQEETIIKGAENVLEEFFPSPSIGEKAPTEDWDKWILESSIEENSTKTESDIQYFFGQSKTTNLNVVINEQDTILASILPNIESDLATNPEELAVINQVFGKASTKKLKDKAVDKASLLTKNLEIATTHTDEKAEALPTIEHFFTTSQADEKTKNMEEQSFSVEEIDKEMPKEDLVLFNKWFGKQVKTTPSSNTCGRCKS